MIPYSALVKLQEYDDAQGLSEVAQAVTAYLKAGPQEEPFRERKLREIVTSCAAGRDYCGNGASYPTRNTAIKEALKLMGEG